MTPDEVRAIRKSFLENSKLFSRILGWGEITTARYESGASSPSPANVIILRMLQKNPEIIFRFFEQTRDNFTHAERETIIQQLSKALLATTE